MKWMFAYFLLVSMTATAQWKSYRLVNDNRDTVNCIDNQDRRQGRWVIKVAGLRGEPGYDEEGMYKDGKKEGIWRCYTSLGDLYAIEQYRWGNRDGKCQYYNISGLQREESWKAVNPDNLFDTVDVYDPVDPTKVEQKLVKIEGTSVKHGKWKYYESSSGALIRSDNYFLGKLQVAPPPLATGGTTPGDSTAINPVNIKPVKKEKPKEVMEFEKKNGKKKVKVFDGSTGF